VQLIGPPPQPADSPQPAPPPPAARGLRSGARLWLVRHAEVEARWHEVAYGAMDVALSEAGREATMILAGAFGERTVTRVIASDLERAALLGQAIAEGAGVPLALDGRLREMDRGSWQGRPKSEFRTLWDRAAADYWRDPYRWHVPDGEGDELIFERAWPALLEGLDAVDGGTLVVAAHGQLIRVVIGRLLGVSSPTSYGYALEPAHAHLLVDAEDGWSLAIRQAGPKDIR
jgi:alpha-ribazole phosphatase